MIEGQKRKFSTHTPSEEAVGYSRAVVTRDGQRMYFSGTTAIDENGETHGQTVYDQVSYVFDKIDGVAKEAGFSMADVVLVRAYLVDMGQIAGFDSAFKALFGNINPSCTLVGSPQLVSPDLLIEIECVLDKG